MDAPAQRKSLITEFRDFIATGDLILIAIAFVLAGLVAAVVGAFIDGVVMPLVAAIFGEPDFTNIGFTVNESRVSIGLVLNALFSLVVTGLVLFAIYKWYQGYKRRQGVIVPPPPGPTDNQLLMEIRDLLRAQAELGRRAP